MKLTAVILSVFLLIQIASAETVILTNGDKITGVLENGTNGTAIIHSPMAGEIIVPEGSIMPAPPEGDNRVRGTVIWDRSVAAGFSLTAGNSSLVNFNGSLKLGRNRLWIDEILLQFAWDYRTDEGEMSYNKLEGKLRYGYSFTKKLYAFTSADFLRDHSKSLAYSLFPKIGFGYWIADVPDRFQCMFELSGGYGYSAYIDEVEQMTQAQFRATVKWTISPGAICGNDFKAVGTPDDLTDWKFDNSAWIGVKIIRALSLRVSYRFQYDTDPAEDNLPADHATSAQFEWKF